MQINTGKEHHLFSHSQYIFILPSCPVHHQHYISYNAANSKVRCKTRRDTVGSGFFFLFPGFLLFSTNTNLPTFSCYHLPPEAVYIQTYWGESDINIISRDCNIMCPHSQMWNKWSVHLIDVIPIPISAPLCHFTLKALISPLHWSVPNMVLVCVPLIVFSYSCYAALRAFVG